MKTSELLAALLDAHVEHLLEMKRAANRPKDQLDIAALEKIQRGEDPNG